MPDLIAPQIGSQITNKGFLLQRFWRLIVDMISEIQNPTIQEVQTPTLLNGWVNVGGILATAGFYKDRFETVHLSGVISSGTTTQDTILFTLPAGFIPTTREVFTVSSSIAPARIDVDESGNVRFFNGSSSFMSLSGITFRATQ